MKLLITFITTTLFLITSHYAEAQDDNFEQFIEIGANMGMGELKNNTLLASIINGYSINKNIFIGLGVQAGQYFYVNKFKIIDSCFSERANTIIVPIYAQIKYSIPTKKVSPFLLLNAGYTIDVHTTIREAKGPMLEFCIGSSILTSSKKEFYFNFGLNLQKHRYIYVNHSEGIYEQENNEFFKSIVFRIGYKIL